MTIRKRKSPKWKPRRTETLTEAISVTVRTSYNDYSPEGQIAKWEEVLETLGKTPNPSPQEALAREAVGKRVRELRELIKAQGKRN